MAQSLSKDDISEIFSRQQANGLFSALAVETACLNRMERLNRRRLDPSLPPAERRAARRRLIDLEGKLVRYIREETPLSYFDADFRDEAERYVMMREIFLKAVSFTFKRHRLAFLLDLLRLYGDDPCSLFPEREFLRKKWEHILLYDYLLLDMGLKNTEDIGREAVSNGYHECDYTLEIEDVWKQPMKSVPRTNFRYVVQSLPCSVAARSTARYIQSHGKDMKKTRWTVDAKAIEQAMTTELPGLTKEEVTSIETTCYRFRQ